ncbi:MAG: ABC transporter permease [Puniceicoccales bacterium]|jgi:oligopeptide transport system permease protein|nr:ABC transporter permease [Puniceicoccales bacterium]
MEIIKKVSFFRHQRLWIAGGFLFVLTLVCFILPFFLPYRYDEQNITLGAVAPSLKHFFGTDMLGRDLCARVLYGGRISLSIGAVATFTALFIGTLYGSISGYIGGNTDMLMMRFVDILYPLPLTLFVILLMMIVGRNIWALFLAIGAIEWLTPARIVRAEVSILRDQGFVQSSRLLGQNTWNILRLHIYPNLLDTLLVYGTLTLPNIMILESFLSFLGLGVQAPQSSWGVLISDGVQFIGIYPWMLLIPSLFFVTTLIALNFFGDGLRDYYMRQRS